MSSDLKTDVEKLYCSVDLEFTGFDPLRDQILEIGFAFFRVSENRLEIVEQWDQVFKPTIEVHPKILGLTGITQEELDNAPDFNEHREFLQQKLGDAVIVGHNPVMDVKFLEQYGLKLSGKIIDTLELVQFILPTHHSYNLENLVHYFGIQHQDNHQAHRALADALATAAVLENLIRIYTQFSSKLKTELQEVIALGNFEWAELLQSKFPAKKIQTNDSIQHEHSAKNAPLILSDKLITIDTSPTDHEARVALGLQNKKTDIVLAVPDANTVMRLWKDELVHGVFTSENTFSKTAFNAFLNNAETQEELRFCLKIIVWLHTNWQTEVILDLNISFFGGQFKNSIVGGKPKQSKNNILCVDYSALQELRPAGSELVICDIQNFEKHISSGFGSKLSWNSVLYSLKSVYNPETDFGEMEFKDEVISALTATDLFFGLAYMLLHSAFPGSEYATLSELSDSHSNIYSRLERAADALADKLALVEEGTKVPQANRTSVKLQNFFLESQNRVKWINIDEHNLSFHDQPVDIAEDVKSLLANYTSVRFTDTLASKDLLSYYTERLGFNTEISEFPKELIPSKLSFGFYEEPLADTQLYELSTSLALPMVIVFPNPSSIKNFYNEHYSEIKKNAALFAQGYSGGGNKMFRNFSIKENSILLATADFIAKQNYKISAQTVIFTELPPIEDEHPYTKALVSRWQKQFPELITLFAFSKLTAALKKLKVNSSVSVRVYKSRSEDIFVDKSR